MQAGGENELNSPVVEATLRLCHHPEKQELAVEEIATVQTPYWKSGVNC